MAPSIAVAAAVSSKPFPRDPRAKLCSVSAPWVRVFDESSSGAAAMLCTACVRCLISRGEGSSAADEATTSI
eukprot:3554346-Prymnesium_polylepis.1